jgi:membrane-bound inhibitor of C-type lysozyme
MFRSSTPGRTAALSAIAFGICAVSLIGGAPLPVTVAQAAPSAVRLVTFACPAGQTLRVEFATSDPQAPAIIHSPAGPAVTLPSLPSGDGFRYGDADYELRGKGNQVTWTEGRNPAITCMVAPASR